MKSNRKYTYKTPVPFFPSSHGNLFKDDPTESNNIILPLEPKGWEYGVYFDDGYDYDQHMVTMSDFKDESKELPKINPEKNLNKCVSKPLKLATVISEFVIFEELNITECSETVEKQFDQLLLGKIRDSGKHQLDEDYVLGFSNAKETGELNEYDRLPDNFISTLNKESIDDESIDGQSIDGESIHSEFIQGVSIKGNEYMVKMFFDDEATGSMEDDEKVPEESSINFDDGMLDSINNLVNLDNYECMPKLKLSENVSTRSAVSLSFMNSMDRYNEKNKKKDFIKPISEEDKKYIVYEDTEYSEKDIDRACDQWSDRKRKVPKNALESYGKFTGHKTQVLEVPKMLRKVNETFERMDVESVCGRSPVTEIVLPNVSQFHVPRPSDETADEKRIRKKNIKCAKRQRLETKKEIKSIFNSLSK